MTVTSPPAQDLGGPTASAPPARGTLASARGASDRTTGVEREGSNGHISSDEQVRIGVKETNSVSQGRDSLINLEDTVLQAVPAGEFSRIHASDASKRPEGAWRTTRYLRVERSDGPEPLSGIADIGKLFPNMSTLIVRGHNLEALQGIAECRELWRLDVSQNALHAVSDLAPFTVLGELHLHKNKLTFAAISALRDVQILQLSLFGNAQIDSYPHYRKFVITLLPFVWVLDGVFVTHQERQRARQYFKTQTGKASQVYQQHGHLLSVDNNRETSKNKITHVCSWRGVEVMRSFAKEPVHSKFVDKRRLRYVAKCYFYEQSLEAAEADITLDYELGKRSHTDPLPPVNDYDLDWDFLGTLAITNRLELMILLAVSLRYTIPPIISAELLCQLLPEEKLTKRFINTFVRFPHFMRRALLLRLHDATEKDRVSGLLRQLEIQLWSSLRVEDDSDDPEADHVLAMLGVNLMTRAPSIEQFNEELRPLVADAQESQADPSPTSSQADLSGNRLDLSDDSDLAMSRDLTTSPAPIGSKKGYSVLPTIHSQGQGRGDDGHGDNKRHSGAFGKGEKLHTVVTVPTHGSQGHTGRGPQPGQRLLVRAGVYATIIGVDRQREVLKVQPYDGSIDDSDLYFQLHKLEWDRAGHWRPRRVRMPTVAADDNRIGLMATHTELFSLNDGWDSNFVLAPAPMIEHINSMFEGGKAWAPITEPQPPGELGNPYDPFSLTQPEIGPIYSNVEDVLAEQWMQDQREATVRRWQWSQRSSERNTPEGTLPALPPRAPSTERVQDKSTEEDAKVFNLTTVPGQESELPAGPEEAGSDAAGGAGATAADTHPHPHEGQDPHIQPGRTSQSRASVRFADGTASRSQSPLPDLGATGDSFESTMRARSPLPQIELNITYPAPRATAPSWFMVPGRPRLVVPPSNPASHPFFEKTRPNYMNTRKFQSLHSGSDTHSELASTMPPVSRGGKTRAAYEAKRRSMLSPSVTSVASIPSSRARSAGSMPIMGQRKTVLTAEQVRSGASSRASDHVGSRRASDAAYHLDDNKPAGARSSSRQSSVPGQELESAVLERLFEKRYISGQQGPLEYYGKLVIKGRAPRYMWIHESDLLHIGNETLDKVTFQKPDSVIK